MIEVQEREQSVGKGNRAVARLEARLLEHLQALAKLRQADRVVLGSYLMKHLIELLYFYLVDCRVHSTENRASKSKREGTR